VSHTLHWIFPALPSASRCC